MAEKVPFILSDESSVKDTFRNMIAETTEAILKSYDDKSAYSGKDVYKLREGIDSLGFLPEQGIGFDKTLDTVQKEIMPHLLRTWSTMYCRISMPRHFQRQ